MPVFAALGALSAVYFAITGTVWAVTGEFTRLGGQTLDLFGANTGEWAYFSKVVHLEGNPWDRTDGWIVMAMLLGSLMSALFAGDFRLRLPVHRRRYAQALSGGIVAGFGARLALGCNLAAMFTGIPQFSLHAWVFTVTTAIGTLAGVALVRQRWWRGPIMLKRVNSAATHDNSGGSRCQLVASAVIAAATVSIAAAYFFTGHHMLAAAVVVGALFGFLIQRGQVCFTSAFRDFWLTGQTMMMKALVIGLALASVTTFAVIHFGWQPAAIKPVSLGTAVGGLLFGLGIVMASACETGMMYRAMEGQVQALFAFVGNIIGATFLAYAWDHLGVYSALVDGSPRINLLQEFGAYGGLGLTLITLAAWYGLIQLREKRHARATATTSKAAQVPA